MELKETTLNSRYLYKGKIIKLRLDRVQLSAGNESDREVVEHQGAAAIVAVIPEGILMVRQYRHPVQQVLLEIPAGKLELGENPEDCARRELAEETGYYARELKPLGNIFTSPGFSSEIIHLFWADKLEWKPVPVPEDENLELIIIPREKVMTMICNGEVNDAKTVAGLLMAFSIQ